MKLQIAPGTTSKILTVFIQDASSSSGAGLGGLDQTSSITGGSVREGSTGIALAVDENVTTEGTYEAPSTAAQVRIGTPANMRTGTYELHVHNDLLATGADSVFITLGGATDMVDLVIEIQLNGLDRVAASNANSVLLGTGDTDDVDLSCRKLDIINDAGVGLTVTGTTIGFDLNATAGIALDVDATGSAAEFTSASGSGIVIDSDLNGLDITSQSFAGVSVLGDSNGVDIAGNTGDGLTIDGGSGAGVAITGTTFGLTVDGSAGPGAQFSGTTFGIEITASAGPGVSAVSSSGNGQGLVVSGNGSGEGAVITGGETSEGLSIVGGSTSGSALKIEATGTDDIGVEIIAIGSGAGIDILSPSGTGLKIDGDLNGLDITSQSNVGVSILGDTNGVDIAGNNGDGMTIDGGGGAGAAITGTTFGIDIDASAGSGVRVVGTANDILANITGTVSGSDVKLDRNADLGESRRGHHQWSGNVFYVDPVNGDDATGDGSRALPYEHIQEAHDDLVTANNHDVICLVPGAGGGITTHSIAGTTTLSKGRTLLRGPGSDGFIITRTGAGDTLSITGDGCEVSGAQIGTAATGSGDGIDVTGADRVWIHDCTFLGTQGDGVHIQGSSKCRVEFCLFDGTGVGGSGQGIHITGTGPTTSNDNVIHSCHFARTGGDSILIEQGTTNDTDIHHNAIHDAGGWGINIGPSSTDAIVHSNVMGNNTSGNITDAGTDSVIQNNEPWTRAVQETTITGLASQTVFNLTNGSSDDNAYNGMEIVVEDKATRVQIARGLISDYDGGDKTITLVKDPGVFTMADGDRVAILASATASGVADEVYTGATHNVTNSLAKRIRELDEQVGYEGGAIWLDTNNGAAGQVVGENGTVNNPSNNITDTVALAVATGRVRIRVASGSTVPLVANLEGYEVHDTDWILQLESFSISGSCIQGATVTGIGTGANRPIFNDCQFGDVTLPPCIIKHSGIGDNGGTFTFGSAGQYRIEDCKSVVPGLGTPLFVATGLGSATGINNRGWFGGADYTIDSDVTISHEVVGGGGTTFNTSGANIEVRGITRSLTFAFSAGGTTPTVQFVGITGPIALSGTAAAGTTLNLYGIGLTPTGSATNVTVTNSLTNPATVAEQVFTLDMSNLDEDALAVENSHTLYSVIVATLESSITGDVWRINQTDGSTLHQLKDVASDSGANPVTGVSG